MPTGNRAFWGLLLAVVAVVGVAGASVLYVSYRQTSGAVLLVVASTDRGVYRVDDVVNVTVRVTNQGSTSVNLSWSCRTMGIRVTDEGGQVVYDSRTGICPLVLGVGALPPGQTETSVYPWTADVPPLARYDIQPEVASGAPGEALATSVWIV